jgi:V8-like Glu-specific endopeptidase
MGAFCSGVLVGDKVVATANHCIKSDADAKATKFVFDFKMMDKDHPQSTFDDSEVFTGKRVILHHPSYTQDDWKLIELQESVTDPSRIATIRRDGMLDQSHKVFAIGYPNGLSVKVSAGGNVRDNHDPKIFLVGLDIYTGNSGGPCSTSSILRKAFLQGATRIFFQSEIVPGPTTVRTWAVRVTR